MKYSTLIVIDGMPFQRSLNTTRTLDIKNFDFVDPSNIQEVTVLKSLAATNRFGNLGANGAILITTKTGSMKSRKKQEGNSAEVQGNYYQPESDGKNGSESPFLKALRTAGSMEDAYSVYSSMKFLNLGNERFFLDAFRYFASHDRQLAAQIISNILLPGKRDLTTLRSAVLGLTSLEAYEPAYHINEEIIRRRPKELQGYLTRAMLNKDMGRWQQALNGFLELRPGKRFFERELVGIKTTVDREISNLLNEHGESLEKPSSYESMSATINLGARLVFQWNDPSREFSIQFVNPKNRFYNWEHSISANKARIEEEMEMGFSIKEFEMLPNDEGNWLINIQAMESNSRKKEPLVVKLRLYSPYGIGREQHEDLVVYFNDHGKIGVTELSVGSR